MNRIKGRIYYGWIVAFAGFLMIGLSVGLNVLAASIQISCRKVKSIVISKKIVTEYVP